MIKNSLLLLALLLVGCGDTPQQNTSLDPVAIEAPQAPQSASALPPPPLPITIEGDPR